MFKYLSALIILSGILLSQSYNRAFHFYTIETNVAMEFMDPMSYFQGDPKPGIDTITFSNNGVNYVFSSWENQQKFSSNLGKYEAEYGGWCAYEMSQKRSKVYPDVYIYRVIDDKLYFFSSEEKAKLFEADYENLSKQAQKHWDIIFQIKPERQEIYIKDEIY